MEEVKAVKRAGFERKRAEESRNLKLCLACSIGGHFTEMLELKDVYEKYEHFFVTNPGKQTISILKNKKKYFMPERKGKKMNFLKQFFLSLKILLIEKPDVIITTGSGDMFWICVLAKLFRKRVIYIESFARVTSPSKFGKVAYKFADLFIYQWRNLKRFYPHGIYGGIIFNVLDVNKEGNCDTTYSYFITVGTFQNDFSRLLSKVDELIERGVINGRVFAQIGHSKYIPKNYEYTDFLDVNEFENTIKKSKTIITHGGVGTIMTALKHGKKVIVVPRYKKFGEIADDHQLDITQELERRRKIIAVYKIDNLSEAIRKAEDVRVTTVMEKQNTNFKEIIIDWLEKEKASL